MPSSPDSGDNAAVPAQDGCEPTDPRFLVRPYCRSTEPTCPVRDLAVETLVSTSRQNCAATTIPSLEHQAIVGVCAEIRSVAEVAALLALPLGITRVLLADTINQGLVRTHGRPGRPGGRPNQELLQRVLAGLYRL